MVITLSLLPKYWAAQVKHPGQFSTGITQVYWSIFGWRQQPLSPKVFKPIPLLRCGKLLT
jgi:hypothetical protein